MNLILCFLEYPECMFVLLDKIIIQTIRINESSGFGVGRDNQFPKIVILNAANKKGIGVIYGEIFLGNWPKQVQWLSVC